MCRQRKNYCLRGEEHAHSTMPLTTMLTSASGNAAPPHRAIIQPKNRGINVQIPSFGPYVRIGELGSNNKYCRVFTCIIPVIKIDLTQTTVLENVVCLVSSAKKIEGIVLAMNTGS